MISQACELTAEERTRIDYFMQSLHEIPEHPLIITCEGPVSEGVSLRDPRLRSREYRKAMYVNHLSLRSLSSRGFNVHKLHIVLDLDFTLVHCITLFEENAVVQRHFEQLKAKAPGFDLSLVSYLQSNTKYNLIVAQRPHLQNFLKCLSEIGTLHICTMADLNYANVVTRAIDPSRRFFGDRIHSLANQPEKSLQLIFSRFYESYRDLTLIFDSQPNIWSFADQPHVLPSHRFIFQAFQDKRPVISQLKSSYTLFGTDIAITNKEYDFCSSADQLKSLKDLLIQFHRKLFINEQPIYTLLEQHRHKMLKGRLLCLSSLQEPRLTEKRIALEMIIQSLGGKLAESGGTNIVENAEQRGVTVSKIIGIWFMLKLLP